MGTHVPVQQMLRHMVKHVSSSSVHLRTSRTISLPGWSPICRPFCSGSKQAALPVKQHSHRSSPGLSLSSLLDMGFTTSQAEQLYDSVSRLRGANVSSTLSALLALGFNAGSVQKLLDKCPEICSVKEAQLQQRISHLRKLGLVEGSLQRTLSHYPKILTVPAKSVKHVAQFLRDKCQFTTQQVTEILRESPAVTMEDLDQLEYKFQYVYFRMGVKQAEMVKCRLFRFTLDDVRCRHTFLERRGLYQTPDKKGQTTIINPALGSILNVDRETFVADVTQASVEEYEVFQKLLAREWKEEEFEHGSNEAYSDDDGDDDEDEDYEKEETEPKSGYKKKKNKSK